MREGREFTFFKKYKVHIIQLKVSNELIKCEHALGYIPAHHEAACESDNKQRYRVEEEHRSLLTEEREHCIFLFLC